MNTTTSNKTTFNARDMGAKFAKAGAMRKQVAIALNNYAPSYIVEPVKTIEAELKEGFALTYIESHKERELYYVRTGEQYNPVDSDTFKSAKADKLHLTYTYAMAFSSSEFGKLKTENPVLHSLVKAMRNDVSKEQSREHGKLMSELRSLQAGESKPRVTKSLLEQITDRNEMILDSVRSHESRVNITKTQANQVRALYKDLQAKLNTILN